MATKKTTKPQKKEEATEATVSINAPPVAYDVRKNPDKDHLVELNKLASELYQRSQPWNTSITNTRERALSLSYDVLDKVAERNPIINAIINKRCDQMRVHCKVAKDERDRGFRIVAKKNAPEKYKSDKETTAMLEEFFIQTGFAYDPDREDDFADFVQLIIRDHYTYDQNSVEIRRTNKGEVHDFWYIDPTTIRRCIDNVMWNGKEIKFVQIDEMNKQVAHFSNDDLIFDYSAKRSRLKYRGHGFSKIEQCLETITGMLFAFSYNKDIFQKDKIPKGFLSVTGDINAETLNQVRRAWMNEMTGYGGRFSVPIVPSGKDGVGINWVPMGQNNRDMEYIKLINLLIAVICSVFSIDPQEIGIKTDMGQALISDSGEARIQNSKDAGLGAILNYVEVICNKILAKITPWYVFEFTGTKNDDRKAEAELNRSEIETFRTIDEVREQRGLEKFEMPWSKVPLNPHVMQMINADKQAEAQAQQMGGGQPGAGGPQGEGGAVDDEELQKLIAQMGGGEGQGEEQEGGEEEERPEKAEKSLSRPIIEIEV